MIWLIASSLGWAATVQTWDFESGPMGFTPSSGLHFEWGSLDDPEANSGWATNLDGNYLNDAHDTLNFPPIDLSTVMLPMLALNHRYTTESGDLGDAGWVEAQADGVWERLVPVYGYPADIGFAGSSGSWRTDVFDLSHLGVEARLRLSFASGTSVSYPGWMVEEIHLHDGDVAPPQISDVYRPLDTDDVEGPYTITATIIDDKAIPSATLFWRVNDGDLLQTPMSALPESGFQANIDGQVSGSVVRWWIEASDGLNTQRFPTISDAEFEVELPAPVALGGAGLTHTNRVAATQTTLSWDLPEPPYTVREFEVHRDEVSLLRTSELEAIVPLIAGLQTFTVTAHFETTQGVMAGAPSTGLMVLASIPEVLTISPASGWPGEQLRLDLTGQDLYLTADALVAGPEDISLTDLTVIDAHHLRAVAAIAEGAQPGPVALTVVRVDGEEISAPAFHVLPPEGMPGVRSAHPATARQGAKTTIFLELDGYPLSHRHPPTVSMGDGVLIESIYTRGSGLDVEIVVAPSAPLGAHAIEVDDGTRILTGAELTVTDQPNQTTTGCSTAHNSTDRAMPWLLLMVGALCSRRRSIR